MSTVFIIGAVFEKIAVFSPGGGGHQRKMGNLLNTENE
jgi:hypothetical protein